MFVISLCMMCLELLIELFVYLDLVPVLVYIIGVGLGLRKQLNISLL